MVSPWPPSTIAWMSSHRDVQRLGEERPVARGVEHARHADHALARETGRLACAT